MILTGPYVYVYNFILTYQLLELVQIQASFETFFFFFSNLKIVTDVDSYFIINNNYKLIIQFYINFFKNIYIHFSWSNITN